MARCCECECECVCDDSEERSVYIVYLAKAHCRGWGARACKSVGEYEDFVCGEGTCELCLCACRRRRQETLPCTSLSSSSSSDASGRVCRAVSTYWTADGEKGAVLGSEGNTRGAAGEYGGKYRDTPFIQTVCVCHLFAPAARRNLYRPRRQRLRRRRPPSRSRNSSASACGPWLAGAAGFSAASSSSSSSSSSAASSSAASASRKNEARLKLV